MQLVRTFRTPPSMDSGSNLLSTLRIPHLLEKGGGTPGPLPLREREGISHLDRQIMKVPGSQELSMEEFFDNIFKSKRKYSYALFWELRDLSLIKRRSVHQITKSD